MSTIDLQSEVEFLSSIIDYLPSDLVVFDLNQCYLYINPNRILTRLDGGIRLSSVLDRGTTVIFTQPSRSKD